MERLYKYHGKIAAIHSSGGKCNKIEITLYDPSDYSKAPSRIDVYGGISNYINKIEGTDAEERYLDADYYYNRILDLKRIEIPSTDKLIPAKVITQRDIQTDVPVIFGPQEYIETSNPEPMNREQVQAWYDFKNNVKGSEQNITTPENETGKSTMKENRQKELYDAVSRNDSVKAKKLIDGGASVQILFNGETPLHTAVKAGAEKCADELIKHGAFPDAFDDRQNTPLYYAVKSDNLDMAKRLLNTGASCEIKTSSGKKVNECAKSDDMAKLIESYSQTEKRGESRYIRR